MTQKKQKTTFIICLLLAALTRSLHASLISNHYASDKLIESAIKGNLENVKYYLSLWADIHTKGEDGYTALIWSALNGRIEVVKHLCQQGADVNVKSSHGDTALILSAYKGHIEVVKHLCQQGADIEAKNKQGYTALMWSAYNGHIEVIKHLVQQGADIEAQNANGKTPLDLAREIKKKEVVQLLENPIKCIKVYFKEEIRKQKVAFETGERESKKKEEQLAAEINTLKTTIENLKAQYKEREAKLVAQYEGKIRKREIEFKGELEARARELAKKKPNKEVIKKWLEVAKKGNIKQLEGLYNNYEINPNVKNEDRYTALHWSARNGHLYCVQFLLKQGADIHYKNSYGYTALLWSAQQGHLACVKYLVEQGADIHAKTRWGETALVWATRKGHLDCAHYLEQKK